MTRTGEQVPICDQPGCALDGPHTHDRDGWAVPSGEQDLEAEYERGYLDGYRAARQHVLTSLFGADVLRDMLDEARAEEAR